MIKYKGNNFSLFLILRYFCSNTKLFKLEGIDYKMYISKLNHILEGSNNELDVENTLMVFNILYLRILYEFPLDNE